MSSDIAIIVHRGFDWAGSLALRRARDAAMLLSSEYSLSVTVYDIPLPVGDDEAPDLGLPEVLVEYRDRRVRVSSASPPGLDEIVDSVFEVLEVEYGSTIPSVLGDKQAEEGLLSV